MFQSSTPSYVIALAGPSGAGKSTLLHELSVRFDGAVVLRIDDYEATSTFPDTAEWLADGADPNALLSPQFVADLHALRSGNTIVAPDTAVCTQPTHVLLVEEPFGKARDQMHDLIDFVVHVDIPLEIALARKLLRQNAFLPWEQDTDLFINHLREFLTWYLSVGRAFYIAVRERVLEQCDLVVDGTGSTEAIVEVIVNAVRAKQQ